MPQYWRWPLCIVAALMSPLPASTQAASPPPSTGSHGELLIGYDQIWLAHDDPLGMASLKYRFDLTPSINAALGTLGAMTGNRGGLFVFGGELGVHTRSSSDWQWSSAVFVGGGGGQRVGVGGGLMIAPEVRVAHRMNGYRLEGSAGYADFPTGSLHGPMVGLTIAIPIDLVSGDPGTAGNQAMGITATAHDLLAYRFTDNYFSVLVQSYGQQRSRTTTGQSDSHSIDLLGVELGHFISDRYFVYLQSAGAFRGIPNGYMDFMGGFGLRYPLPAISHWFAEAKLGVGGAGGGQRETSGGFVVKPEVGLEYALSRRVAIEANAGYIESAGSSFKGTVLSAALDFHFGLAHPAAGAERSNASVVPSFHTWQIQVSSETYFRPQRDMSSGNSRPDIDLVSFALNSFVSRHFYFTGQVASAYVGNSGGYATGMFGAGAETGPILFRRVRATLELLVGAAGGGGIDVGGGVVAKANAGVNYWLTDKLHLTLDVGRIKAMQAQLNATTLRAGVSYRFALLQI